MKDLNIRCSFFCFHRNVYVNLCVFLLQKICTQKMSRKNYYIIINLQNFYSNFTFQYSVNIEVTID